MTGSDSRPLAGAFCGEDYLIRSDVQSSSARSGGWPWETYEWPSSEANEIRRPQVGEDVVYANRARCCNSCNIRTDSWRSVGIRNLRYSSIMEHRGGSVDRPDSPDVG